VQDKLCINVKRKINEGTTSNMELFSWSETLRIMRKNHSFETILAAANHTAFKSSTCMRVHMRACRDEPQSRHVMRMPSSAVCSELAGRAVRSLIATKRSESEYKPMSRALVNSRVETGPMSIISNFMRPKG
jgi:hypothetical protein